MIRNTKDMDPLVLLIGALDAQRKGKRPGADIEEMEARGQQELAHDTALPVKGLQQVAAAFGWIKTGERFGTIRENDPLFADVKLPDGWKVVPTDHSMWSDLVDDQGVKRAAIFYKAAFYDRDAFIRLV